MMLLEVKAPSSAVDDKNVTLLLVPRELWRSSNPPLAKTPMGRHNPPLAKTPMGRHYPPLAKTPTGRHYYPPVAKTPMGRQYPLLAKTPTGRHYPPLAKTPMARHYPLLNMKMTVTETAKGYYGLVTFLWALANGMGYNVGLSDPPVSEQRDTKGQKIMMEIFQGTPKTLDVPNATPVGNPTGGPPNRLSAALVEHVKAMTESTLKSIERENIKKSMLSRLSGEAADLFILLSAKTWNDPLPRIHTFTRQLIANKDMMKASNLAAGHVRDKILEGVSQQQGPLPISKHRVCCYRH
jgi:hypothetical protein